jgi:protein TonB
MFLSIISIVALCVFLFSMDLSWSNVISSQRNDLVFEGRNHEYGAYALRKEHHLNVFYALLLSLGLIGGGLFVANALKSEAAPKLPPYKESTIIPFIIKPDETEKPKAEDQPKATQKQAQKQPLSDERRTVAVVEDPIIDDTPTEPIAPAGGIGDTPGIGGPIVVGTPGGTGQDAGSDKPLKKPRRYVRNNPTFPGGESAMLEYMKDKVKLTELDKERGVNGIIFISFVVNEDGSIRDILVERGIMNGEGLAQKATHAIQGMPRWNPGNDGEEPLPVIVTMPLRIEVRN